MRTMIAALLLCLFIPSVGMADRYYRDSYRHGAPYSSSDAQYGRYGHHSHRYRSHQHSDDWIVPLAIVGGLIGIVALSEMNRPPPPPPPPQRICRDTYDYYDDYGTYLYSRYVDRPCY